VDRSLRRHGQFLVAIGALLGALAGVVLGLAVENTQTSAAVAAPARAAASAVAPPSSQPTAVQPARSGEQADGDASTGRQRTRLAYRPDQGPDRAHKDSKRERERGKEPRNHANGKPGEDNAGKGSGK
jgi:hypothetical protein